MRGSTQVSAGVPGTVLGGSTYIWEYTLKQEEYKEIQELVLPEAGNLHYIVPWPFCPHSHPRTLGLLDQDWGYPVIASVWQ